MKSHARRFYRGRGAGKVIAGIIIALIVLAMIVYAALFFGLRKYAVYTPEGVRLEVPWLQETPEEAETP
ncbi:MAG: hypothetical protein IKR21_02975 [Oscillospiraceae bacterium]|nr:hypothetical protein [Oscillospiraceae bacterium]